LLIQLLLLYSCLALTVFKLALTAKFEFKRLGKCLVSWNPRSYRCRQTRAKDQLERQLADWELSFPLVQAMLRLTWLLVWIR